MDKDEKKPKTEKDDKEKSIEELLSEAEDALKELMKEAGSDEEIMKMLPIKPKKMSPTTRLLVYFVFLISDLLIMSAISGYVDWFHYSHNLFLGLVLVSVTFTILDTFLRAAVSKMIPSIVFFTFGLVHVIVAILSLWISVTIVPGFEVKSQSLLALFLVLFNVIRIIITRLWLPLIWKDILSEKGSK